MHDPLHNPQPEIVYQVIGNWYLSVINHVSIVSRLKVSSCVNSKQSTQTLGRLQTASVVVTVGSLGNMNTFIRHTFVLHFSRLLTVLVAVAWYVVSLRPAFTEINCVNIKQRRYNRGPWRPEFIILIIWTGRHVKNPSLLLEHCVRSLDYSTCLFNVFDGNGLPLWACTFSDNHCCEVKQNISGCRAKPGAVPWITVEMLKTPWLWSRTMGSSQLVHWYKCS